jgi:hypothetical protein
MLRLAGWALLIILIGMQRPSLSFAQGGARSADSLVLERTICYGTCPAYRLLITHAGRLRFVGTHPQDSTRVSASLPRKVADSIFRALDEARFLTFPAKIADDPSLCPDRATDHPTVLIVVYLKSGVRRVEDYHGCYLRPDHSVAGGLAALRALEDSIDRLANTSRWVRALPNRY